MKGEMDAVCPKCHRKFSLPDNGPPPLPGKITLAKCPFCSEKKPVEAFVREWQRVELAAAAAIAGEERERQERVIRLAREAAQEEQRRIEEEEERMNRRAQAVAEEQAQRDADQARWWDEHTPIVRSERRIVNNRLMLLDGGGMIIGGLGIVGLIIGAILFLWSINRGTAEQTIIGVMVIIGGINALVMGIGYVGLAGIWSAVERTATMMEERKEERAEPEPLHPPTEAREREKARTCEDEKVRRWERENPGGA